MGPQSKNGTSLECGGTLGHCPLRGRCPKSAISTTRQTFLLQDARASGDSESARRLLELSGRGSEAMQQRTEDIKKSLADAADTLARTTRSSKELEQELR